MSTERDLPPDEHLRAALRHAPDADLQAPPQLRERLLAEARRAVRPAAAPAAEPWWRRWFPAGGWLPQGALASLLVAGLVTLLWQHEEVPAPTVESRAPAVAADSAAPAAAPAPEASAPAPLAKAEAAPRAALPEPVPATKPAPAMKRAAPAAPTADAAPAPAVAAQEAAREAMPMAAAPAPAPAVAPPPPPAMAEQRQHAAAPVGALQAAARIAPLPPWGRTAPPPALAELAARLGGPWRDAAQPEGQPLLSWEREGALVGRAWVERRGDAEWLVWCGTATAPCREAPLDKDKAPPR